MKLSVKKLAVLAAFSATIAPLLAGAQVLSENFEDGVLDNRISISTIGSFNLNPGIQSLTNFGSTKAFGFGLSTCGANCFNSFVTTLKITFAAPTFVGAIKFKEMELFDNWGSNGLISVDGVSLTGALSDFGRLPYNDRIPDTIFRDRSFDVNRVVSSIVIGVYDITNLSQIALDDLVITSVPEPSVAAILLVGMMALVLRRRQSQGSLQDA